MIDYVSLLTGEKFSNVSPEPPEITGDKANPPEVLQTYWDNKELQEAYQKYLRVCKEQDQTRIRASGNKIAILKSLQAGGNRDSILKLALETIGDITGVRLFTQETQRLL